MVILAPISKIMAVILQFIYDNVVPNYGWGIILLTLLLRLILFPTAINQVRSMEKMKILQPKLKEIQDKYGHDREEVARRTIELYRAHNYNMFSGCLPMLIQLPILWALFNLLRDPSKYPTHDNIVISLENAKFFGILLTSTGNPATILGDSLGNFILALLSAGTTYLQQKLISPQQAPASDAAPNMQSTFMYMMPLLFGWFSFTWAAAISIYWVAQNVIGILQQLIIVKFFMPRQAEPVQNEPGGKGGMSKAKSDGAGDAPGKTAGAGQGKAARKGNTSQTKRVRRRS